MFWTSSRRWNPFAEFEALRRELDRSVGTPSEFPLINLRTNDDEALLTAELPGIEPKELEITVKDDTVTLKGSRPETVLAEGQTFVKRERGGGQFSRSFLLPFRIEADKVKAEYQRGILKIVLPRAEADRARKVKISA